MVAVSGEGMSCVDVFRAQRLFKAFSNKARHTIEIHKWNELLDESGLRSSWYGYDQRFDVLGCSFARFMTACNTWFPFKSVWEKVRDRVAVDWLDLDRSLEEINSQMEEMRDSVNGMSEDAVLLAISTEPAAPLLLSLMKIRLASLLLGGELDCISSQPPSRALCAEELETAKHGLRYALDWNPAWWEAHAWLGVALWRSGEVGEAQLCVRRALMLNRNEGRMWCVLGRMAWLTEDYSCARCAWMTGAAMGDFYAAVQYGRSSEAGGGYEEAAAAYKLAVSLAGTSPGKKALGERLLKGVVAKKASCADVAPLKPFVRMTPESPFGTVMGLRLVW